MDIQTIVGIGPFLILVWIFIETLRAPKKHEGVQLTGTDPTP
jgi:hypothetical protein